MRGCIVSADLFILGLPVPTGVVTIDGTYLDLYANDATADNNGFVFAVGDVVAALGGGDAVGFQGPLFGGGQIVELYDPSHWSANVAVPEAAFGWFLLADLALLIGICALRTRFCPN